MKILKMIGGEYLAQFDCHLRPFVFHIGLDNETQPQIVSLLFEEANEAGLVLADPIRFTVKLQANTCQWIEMDNTRNKQEQILAKEVFRDQSAAVLRLVLGRIRTTRYDEDACLSAFDMSRQDIMKGILVSYTEVMTYGEDGKKSPSLWFGYDLTYETKRYLIDDRYCPNPECNCRAVNLDFNRLTSGKMTSVCLASITFDGQKVDIRESRLCSTSHGRILLDRLLAQEAELLVECNRRYERIRQATKRISQKQQPLANTFFEPRSPSNSRIVSIPPHLPSAKIGRNGPCPCGSGRKYKQCCGG